jgi:hypothetical protein
LQLQRDYIQELVSVWQSAAKIEGMLLSEGLERPLEARMEAQMDTNEH